ncbi:MAG: DHH family phosphoesterase [Deferribacteraceae bacterium]|jgi:nanoRNase/pAp phosphatase (c-di-AMP/oligoRNAs hydrolase)|nr:DHH family phosphoesterase [Deferribacteraceae bacterium]
MIEEILGSIESKKHILILTHNNPDPDAMAAAMGLKHLFQMNKKRVTIAYMGIVGRLENREFVKQCKIDMQHSFGLNFRRFDHIIVVDTHPLAGNVYIAKGFNVNTIIDHHISNLKLAKQKDLIADIRPAYGSTCTIVAEYYNTLSLIPDTNTATALCYGIISDIMGNARDNCLVDQQMLGFLYPHVSISKLGKIENPDLPRYHFKTLRRAIENSIVIDELLFCDLDEVHNSDLIAETADYLTRMREIRCVFVIGKFDNAAFFSLRYKSANKPVGRIAMKIVKGIGYGGGHTKSAGGQIPLINRVYSEIVGILKSRLLKYMCVNSVEEKPI